MFKKVTIVGGAGHVGLAFALICISKNINVHIHDTNEKALSLIKKGVLPHKEKNGLISVPSISKYPVLKDGEFIICASDGFWDCWKYEEIFDQFIENKETWEKKHRDHAMSLFGGSYDDMSAYFI